ncbi:MAG: hypothetical protein Q8M65_06165 [Rhodoglobus sp.]|nr:hypothetical protein [Rhodoglobus sp.]
MTLNASFAGTARASRRGRLGGSERGLDALIGLVILIVELLIGSLALTALYALGLERAGTAADAEAVQAGFLIAAAGSAIFVGITTITYLSRIVRGHRSWTAPLWGIVLMTAALVIGYITMSSGL